MKKIVFIALTMFLTYKPSCQQEFQTHESGLIYSKQTMLKLNHIVDSLNLKYKNCGSPKTFYSIPQTKGHFIELEGKSARKAKNDMDKNISFEDFVALYPKAKIEKNHLIVKHVYENYDNEKTTELAIVFLNNKEQIEIDMLKPERPAKNTWHYIYYSPSDYTTESITAIYLPEDFTSFKLDEKYAKAIGYADCLMDTSNYQLRKKTREGRIPLPENWRTFTDSQKKKLLEEMLSTKVIGFCSQDKSPREHALNIAMLSAETTSWEVFLRSHLDIMNDKFARMIDGSYAYAKRQTYIREIEELDINVLDLIIGISLRVENPAKNHYYGRINRTGRAISESKNLADIKVEFLKMIADPALDDYNRVLIYYLYLNFNHYIENESEKKANETQLESALVSLPDYLYEKLEPKK